MVWANCGKQNSRLVTFLPGSRLPFAVVSYIYRKTGRERLKLLSKMASKKWNTNFRLGHYDRENGFFFQTSVGRANFPPKRPDRNDPFTFQPDFPETFSKRHTAVVYILAPLH